MDRKAPNMNWELVEKDRTIIKGDIPNSTWMISGMLQALLVVTFLVDTFMNGVQEKTSVWMAFQMILLWQLAQVQIQHPSVISNITVITLEKKIQSFLGRCKIQGRQLIT